MFNKTIRERLLSGAAWATAGKIASGLIGIAISALLARLLSAEEMGSYFLAISILGIFALMAQLGLQQAVVRFIGEAIGQGNWGRVRDTVKLVLRNGAIGSLVTALIFFLLSNQILMMGFHAPNLLDLKWLIAIWIVIMAINGIVSECFRGLHNIKLATLFGGLLSSLVFFILLLINAVSDIHLDLERVVLFSILASILSVLLALGFLKQAYLAMNKLSKGYIALQSKELMKAAWSMWITGGALFVLSQADILILSMYRSASEVAIYGAASKLVALVAMSLLIVNAVIPPIIAELYTQNRKAELEKILRTTASIAGIPTFIILIIFIFQGESLLALVYGDYYRGGGLILTILSIGQLVNVFTGSCGMTLIMTGHQSTMMLITLASGTFTIALALFLSNGYGATGVAIAAASGLVLQNTGMLIGAKLKTGMWTHWGNINMDKLYAQLRRA